MNFTSGLPVASMSGSVDLVREKLVDAGVPLLGRLAHRQPDVGVEEVRSAHRLGGVLGDGDPRPGADGEAPGDRLDLRGRPERFGRGDPDVHAEQSTGDEQGVRGVVAGVAEVAVRDLLERAGRSGRAS